MFSFRIHCPYGDGFGSSEAVTLMVMVAHLFVYLPVMLCFRQETFQS